MLTASDECYYYLRNQNNHPVATVCLLRYGTDVARGISICAKIDQFDKYIGKGIAYSRAIKGIKILKQADKPLTERQIRLGQKKDNLGKKNRRYVEFEMVQRKEAIGVVLTGTNSIVTHKLYTLPLSALSDFEKTLVKKLGWV